MSDDGRADASGAESKAVQSGEEPAAATTRKHARREEGEASPSAKVGVAFAEGSEATEQLKGGDTNPVRDAGPDDMRDENGDDWDEVDQGSDESFPASDPPCYSVPKR
jgi:hypothetical protein